MYYPGLGLVGIMFFTLREAIASGANIDQLYFELEGHMIIYMAPLNPRLSKTMSLAEYDANLPVWKEQFVEKAKTDVDPSCYKVFLIGYEIGQLAAHLIGKLPDNIELPEFDFRKSKSMESIARFNALCVECIKSAEVIGILEATAKQIEESLSLADLERIAHSIADWDQSLVMRDIAWSYK